MSPILFNCVLEEVFRSLNWDGRGVDISGEKISNLRFAYDVVLIAETSNQFLNNVIRIIKKRKTRRPNNN